MYPHDSICEQIPRTNSKTTHIKNNHQTTTGPRRRRTSRRGPVIYLWQHRTIPALRLKHRSGGCGTATALPKCSIMSGCGTRIVLRGQKPLALCDRCPCFGSLFPPLAALTFAASSIICAFWPSSCRTSLAVSALRIMRYCLSSTTPIENVRETKMLRKGEQCSPTEICHVYDINVRCYVKAAGAQCAPLCSHQNF